MMNVRVICECTEQGCTCEGKCADPAKAVVVPGPEGAPKLAVCHSCGRWHTEHNGCNYSTSSETEILQHVPGF